MTWIWILLLVLATGAFLLVLHLCRVARVHATRRAIALQRVRDASAGLYAGSVPDVYHTPRQDPLRVTRFTGAPDGRAWSWRDRQPRGGGT